MTISPARRAEPLSLRKTVQGTVIVALSGFAKTEVEIAPGTTLRAIVNNIAGGVREGCDLKAVQVGGPWGGLIPVSNFDVAFDDTSLRAVGCSLGDGSLTAVDSRLCVVELAQRAAAFAHGSICGECTFGREGTRQLSDVLRDLTTGRGSVADLELLKRVGEAMKVGSACINGATAPEVVLTALEHFRAEFEAHAEAKQCPANVCNCGKQK